MTLPVGNKPRVSLMYWSPLIISNQIQENNLICTACDSIKQETDWKSPGWDNIKMKENLPACFYHLTGAPCTFFLKAWYLGLHSKVLLYTRPKDGQFAALLLRDACIWRDSPISWCLHCMAKCYLLFKVQLILDPIGTLWNSWLDIIAGTSRGACQLLMYE